MNQTDGARPVVPPNKISVLVADDEPALCSLLQISLQRQGYHVTVVHNGKEALSALGAASAKFDLVLLDVMMPEMDGFTTCAEIRKERDVPIVMLTALNRPDDIIHGFALGADDYITKPFTFREVEVRLQAILRRVNWNQDRSSDQVVQVMDVALNDDVHEVTVRGELVHLTPIEYQLLRTLISAPDRPVSKEDLFQSVWGYNMAGGTNLVEVAMRRLREKIEDDPSNPVYLLTVRGVGYKFNTQGLPEKVTINGHQSPASSAAV
ncbi:MAG: response regulator transcription factor [Anaerolineales bacterium]|nr:response regulator transcription factor [Anaerolineales bacterium]